MMISNENIVFFLIFCIILVLLIRYFIKSIKRRIKSPNYLKPIENHQKPRLPIKKIYRYNPNNKMHPYSIDSQIHGNRSDNQNLNCSYEELLERINASVNWGNWKNRKDPHSSIILRWRSARPTTVFWELWRKQKAMIRNLGMKVFKIRNQWWVSYYPHKSILKIKQNQITKEDDNRKSNNDDVGLFITNLDKDFRDWEHSKEKKT